MNSEGKPRIGITSSDQRNKLAVFAIKRAVRRSGGMPVVLTPKNKLYPLDSLQGLVISGGTDIEPQQYKAQNDPQVSYDPDRDQMEKALVGHAFIKRLPILGICRGFQMMNVAKGGTLHQNLSDFFKDFIPTRSTFAKTMSRRQVTLESHGKLAMIMQQTKHLKVNSIHHQGINILSDEFKIVARDIHGIVQAIESVDPFHFAIGVQWHPEYMPFSKRQRMLFKHLIKQSAAYIPEQ